MKTQFDCERPFVNIEVQSENPRINGYDESKAWRHIFPVQVNKQSRGNPTIT